MQRLLLASIFLLSTGALLSSPTTANAQAKCAAGTKRCGPVCIPVADTCSITSIGAPKKRTNVRKKIKKSVVKKSDLKTPVLATTPKVAVVRVEGCASHVDLDSFSVETAENILRAAGWSMTPADTKTAEGVNIAMLPVTKDTTKASIGVFAYDQSSAATLFTYDMRRYTNTAVVQSPDFRKVLVAIVDGGDRTKALDVLQNAVQCTKKTEE